MLDYHPQRNNLVAFATTGNSRFVIGVSDDKVVCRQLLWCGPNVLASDDIITEDSPSSSSQGNELNQAVCDDHVNVNCPQTHRSSEIFTFLLKVFVKIVGSKLKVICFYNFFVKNFPISNFINTSSPWSPFM